MERIVDGLAVAAEGRDATPRWRLTTALILEGVLCGGGQRTYLAGLFHARQENPFPTTLRESTLGDNLMPKSEAEDATRVLRCLQGGVFTSIVLLRDTAKGKFYYVGPRNVSLLSGLFRR
jgi:hypothetical protein